MRPHVAQMATPLWYACLYGRVGLVQALISAGCDLNLPDVRGMTPLMVAVSRVRGGLLGLLFAGFSVPIVLEEFL